MTGRRESPLPQIATWAQQVDQIAQERRFFHWELEFPEVFFDRHGQTLNDGAGFDAVIGNPPYVSVRDLINSAPEERKYLSQSGAYSSAEHVWDLYMLIVERAFSMLQKDRYCSFIVPVMFLHQQNAQKLRRYMIANGVYNQLLDLSNLVVFEEAILNHSALKVQRFAQD